MRGHSHQSCEPHTSPRSPQRRDGGRRQRCGTWGVTFPVLVRSEPDQAMTKRAGQAVPVGGQPCREANGHAVPVFGQWYAHSSGPTRVQLYLVPISGKGRTRSIFVDPFHRSDRLDRSSGKGMPARSGRQH